MATRGLVSTNSSTLGRGKRNDGYRGVEVDLQILQLDIMNKDRRKASGSHGTGVFKTRISEEEKLQPSKGHSEFGGVVVIQLEGALATKVFGSKGNVVASCWTCGSVNSLQEG